MSINWGQSQSHAGRAGGGTEPAHRRSSVPKSCPGAGDLWQRAWDGACSAMEEQCPPVPVPENLSSISSMSGGRKWESRVGRLGNAALRDAPGSGEGEGGCRQSKCPCISWITQTHPRRGRSALQGSTVPASAPAGSARRRRAARLRPPAATLACDAEIWVCLSAPASEI